MIRHRRRFVQLVIRGLLGLFALGVIGSNVSAQMPFGSGSQSKSAQGDSEVQQTQPDMSSPRATLVSFYELAQKAANGDDDAWADAAKTFNVAAVDPATAPALAQSLKAVLDKLGGVSQSQLPSAKQAAALGLERVRYFPTKDDAWISEQLNQSIPSSLILELSPDGNWRFSAQTLANLKPLEAYLADVQPRFLPVVSQQVMDLLGPTFTRTPLWAWGGLLGCILLGLILGKLLQAIIRKLAKRGQTRNHKLRAAAVEDAASPISLAMLTVGILAGLQLIHLDPKLTEFSWRIVAFLFIVAVGWFIYNLVDLVEVAVRGVVDKGESKVGDMAVPMVRKALRIFVVIVFALAVAQNIFGLNITGWLAGIGVAGIAISLAAQDSLKNLFGSLTVLFDKPFGVGDFIVFMDEMGTVEQIGFRSSRLRLLSGALITVPNMHFTDQKVQNISARPYIRREMNITITYDTPADKIEQAVEILRDILGNDEEVTGQGRFDFDNFKPRVSFNEFNDMSLNIRAYYWYQFAGDSDRGFYTWLDHCQLVNMKLFRRYEQAGIDFAFPTQTLQLAGDPKRQLSVNVNQQDR